MEDILHFAKKLNEEILHLKSKQPYHINVIDELHINENAHSRILCKLLQFRNERGTFEILQSLLDYITQKKQRDESSMWHFINISSPLITQEEKRIDLWIRDVKGGYSVIMENKVYDAEDQESQIWRYIKETEAQGFKPKQIFVIYLPSTSESEPSEQTWNGLFEEYKSRYVNPTFTFLNDFPC